MSVSPPEPPTLTACLTPPGTAAIAALAVRGPRAWAVVRALFRPTSGRALPAEPEASRFWLGKLGEEGRGGSDEVVLAVKRGGPSPWLELHCHGGREVVRLLQEVLAAGGAEVCPWEELERRTADGPVRAEALAALTRAATPRTAAILLDQYHGAFDRAIETVRGALRAGDLAGAGRLLGELAAWASLGRHLTEPWRVVMAGAPNVGKSSLVNALAGYRRSVVAAVPGTTRDVVTVRVALDGWPVELADTAGWREGAGALESAGINLARAAAADADLCLWVLDGSAEPVWPGPNLRRTHYVLNKVDLPPAWELERAPGAIRVSARTGAGVGELVAAVANWLVPKSPPPGAAVPFTPELCRRVGEAQHGCSTGAGGEAERLLEGFRADRG